MENIDKYKPAIPKTYLILLAGIVWECVGILLIVLALTWLSKVSDNYRYIFAGTGLLFALLIHHFGFLRIVDKNLKRILQMDGKKCMFSFFPRKSYLLIILMVAMGSILRHSIIPKEYLAILYIGIGLALILSSIRYLRIFFTEIKRH